MKFFALCKVCSLEMWVTEFIKSVTSKSEKKMDHCLPLQKVQVLKSHIKKNTYLNLHLSEAKLEASYTVKLG